MYSETKLIIAKSLASVVNLGTAALVFESKSALVASAALGINEVLSVEKTDKPVSATKLALDVTRNIVVGTAVNFIISGVEQEENRLDISKLTSPIWED